MNLPKKEDIKEPEIQNFKKNNNQLFEGFNGNNIIGNSSSSKLGKLIEGKHPIYGSKKVDEIKSRKDESKKLIVYNYPLNIEYSSNEESISILFVGQSGAGKSTFINAYVNHILGITCNDIVRYKLIFGDIKKEKDQTQSQTDFITIYNVRSLKYNNKLFKLIDTPGAGDTRNDNEKQLSKTEKDKKEKEFLAMYNKLFSEEIGQLNSIVFVVKASENRENEFQKKIVKNITDLFADDIGQNCLAILTFTDNDEVVHYAVQLMEKMDIFKKKSKKNEEWYFPVSSTSYFIPFKIGSPTESFNFTEKAFEDFTKKLLSLKVYLTKETQKNLELKNRQEKIIKILKENILENLLNKIISLKDTEINLKQKIEECTKQQEEIEKIKSQVTQEVSLKNEIQRNYELHSNLKNQKLQDLENNKKSIEALKTKNSNLEEKINKLKTQQEKAEKEKKEAEHKQRQLQNDIKAIQDNIKKTEDALAKKKKETIETQEIKKLKESLASSKTTISNLENEIKSKKEAKDTKEMIELKASLAKKADQINALNDEINKKKNEGETEEMKRLKNSLEESKKNFESLNSQIEKEKRLKEEEIKRLEKNLLNSQAQFDVLNREINSQTSYLDKEIQKLKESLNNKMMESKSLNIEIARKENDKKNFEQNMREIEGSRNDLLEEIEQTKREEERLQKQLDEEERKLNEQLEKQRKLIGLDNVNRINLSEKEGSLMIEKIKEKIIKQINDKKKERATKIKYEEKNLVDDPDEETNLICNKCKLNCHCNCECWRILFWKPTFACDVFKDSICIECGHHKDYHERVKKYYKTYKKERSISPSKKRVLDEEISKLEDSLDNFSKIAKTQKNVLESKKQIEEDKIRKMNKYHDVQGRQKDKYTDVKLKEYEIEQNRIRQQEILRRQKEDEKKLLELQRKREEAEQRKKEMYNNIRVNEEKLNKLNTDKAKTINNIAQQKASEENKLIEKEKQLNQLNTYKKSEISNIEQQKMNAEYNLKIQKAALRRLEDKKNMEIEKTVEARQKAKNALKEKEEELEKLENEMKTKKQKDEQNLQNQINSNLTKKDQIKEKLENIKIDEEKIQMLKQTKEDRDKEKAENEEKIKKEQENKKAKEEELEKEKEKIEEAEKKLHEKDSLIQDKKNQINNLTNVLEGVYKSEQKRLEEEKESIEKELNRYKHNAIKQFLTIKIINEEIQKLTLNKATISSVTELINDLSFDKRFINNRQYFDEIIGEYEKVIKEIDETNGHPEKIYKRYDLDPESIRKIENKVKK